MIEGPNVHECMQLELVGDSPAVERERREGVVSVVRRAKIAIRILVCR